MDQIVVPAFPKFGSRLCECCPALAHPKILILSSSKLAFILQELAGANLSRRQVSYCVVILYSRGLYSIPSKDPLTEMNINEKLN